MAKQSWSPVQRGMAVVPPGLLIVSSRFRWSISGCRLLLTTLSNQYRCNTRTLLCIERANYTEKKRKVKDVSEKDRAAQPEQEGDC